MPVGIRLHHAHQRCVSCELAKHADIVADGAQVDLGTDH